MERPVVIIRNARYWKTDFQQKWFRLNSCKSDIVPMNRACRVQVKPDCFFEKFFGYRNLVDQIVDPDFSTMVQKINWLNFFFDRGVLRGVHIVKFYNQIND